LDSFVKELQDEIYEETRKAYGDEAFRRWQNPLYMGKMEDPDAYASVRGSCGDRMEMFLRFENEVVKDASFLTDGCGSSTVCGSFAAEMALGRPVEEVFDVTGEAIIERLGGLPEEDEHCAFLAAETLQEAVNDYMLRTAKNETGQPQS